MTPTKAKKVTGLEIRPIDKKTWGAWDKLTKIAEASHHKESIALTLLVNKVLAIRSRQVMALQDFKCHLCARTKALQIHHLQYRSHGRNDQHDNLVAVCNDCHAEIHKGAIKL